MIHAAYNSIGTVYLKCARNRSLFTFFHHFKKKKKTFLIWYQEETLIEARIKRQPIFLVTLPHYSLTTIYWQSLLLAYCEYKSWGHNMTVFLITAMVLGYKSEGSRLKLPLTHERQVLGKTKQKHSGYPCWNFHNRTNAETPHRRRASWWFSQVHRVRIGPR